MPARCWEWLGISVSLESETNILFLPSRQRQTRLARTQNDLLEKVIFTLKYFFRDSEWYCIFNFAVHMVIASI